MKLMQEMIAKMRPVVRPSIFKPTPMGFILRGVGFAMPQCPMPNEYRRVATVNFKGRDRLGGYPARHDDRTLAQLHTGTDKCSRADPSAVLYPDGRNAESKGGIRPIVVAGTKIGALRHTGMAPDRDVRQIVDPDILPNPGMLPDCQPPRELDPDTRFDDNTAPYLGPEPPQDPSPERR